MVVMKFIVLRKPRQTAGFFVGFISSKISTLKRGLTKIK